MKSLFSAVVLSLSCICALGASPVNYKVKVLEEYPHDVTSYTQGLFFKGDTLVESAGGFGNSRLRKVDLRSGKALKNLDFNGKFFVEGSVEFEGKIYVLTWTNRRVFIYDADDFSYKGAYVYPRDGWGLTTDGRSLIASDGSSKLYFMDGELKLLKTIDVSIDGKPLKYLNELEWIDGRIWANVYTTDYIAVINPSTGAVEGVVDCSGLLPSRLRTIDTDVLNGIAVSKDGAVFLTGKNWPRLYKVEIKPAR